VQVVIIVKFFNFYKENNKIEDASFIFALFLSTSY